MTLPHSWTDLTPTAAIALQKEVTFLKVLTPHMYDLAWAWEAFGPGGKITSS